jgi:hypothetical protein
MRKSIVAFLFFVLMLGGVSMTAYAVDCTKDSVVDKFGDWFGNLGKPEKKKKQNIAIRRANRLADCAEKKSRQAAGTV